MTRGVIHFRLPTKLAYHTKVLLGGLFVTVFFNVLWHGTPITPSFWVMLGLAVLQLEIFLVIAKKIFPPEAPNQAKEYKKNIVIRLLMFYFLILTISMTILFFTMTANVLFNNASFPEIVDEFLSRELKGFLISWSISVAIASIVFFYAQWTNALNREQKLREEKLVFQYETLKNQVNPHFLFNSLNTLASLVSKDAALSELYIMKFSLIYRYILENANRDFVGLNEEIGFIQDYFFLQKIRDDRKINLTVEIDDPEAYRSLPISIQLLVENALKHNAATRENPLSVKIYLERDDLLVVENNVQKKMHMGPSSKKGLKNLSERISLVMNKELIIEQSPKTFLAKLPIIKITHAGVDRRR